MNTEFLTKPAGNVSKALRKPNVKFGALVAYRGLSVGAIAWLYATFPTKDAVSRQWQTISKLRDQIVALEKELAVERATSLHISAGTNNHIP